MVWCVGIFNTPMYLNKDNSEIDTKLVVWWIFYNLAYYVTKNKKNTKEKQTELFIKKN